MEPNVNFLQGAHAALFYGFSVAPFFEGDNQLAELRAPIAQMVYADGRVSERLEDFAEAAAYRGGAEMSDVKGLGYVYRAVIYANRASLSDVFQKLAVHVRKLCENSPRGGFSVEKEIDVAVYRLRAFHKPVRREFFRYLRGDCLRRLFKARGKLEAGQGDVAHTRVGDVLKQGGDFVGTQSVKVEHG